MSEFPSIRTAIPTIQDLGDDRLAVVRIALPYCRFPHPDTVSAMDGAVFPTVRNQANRMTLDKIAEREVLLDDNVTPRWALLWSHGIPATGHPVGWTFAHVWPTPRDPDAYTHLANLCMMPEYFGSLSDKRGPLCRYLRYHARHRYGWWPGDTPPEEPPGYQDLTFEYLPLVPDPRGAVHQRMSELNNQRVRALQQLMLDWPPSVSQLDSREPGRTQPPSSSRIAASGPSVFSPRLKPG